MNLIALAVPFFLLALLVEVVVDRFRQTGYYRSNDAINSLSAGIISESSGYFTKFVEYSIWALVLGNFAVFEWQRSWFDSSVTGILLWILAAVLWDFCYYWRHRLGHEMSILWAAHAVHHQSEEYNLSTALRQTSTGFLFGWIFYVPLFVIGFPLEVLLIVSAVNLIYQFWVHTRLIGRIGPLESVLMTPSHHRVHHAQNERYIDKNYGGMFIIWDRLFGTYEPEDDAEPVLFGVRKPLGSWNPFWANLQVYDYLLFDARKAQRWRDKLGIWFHRTGWRPPDVAAQDPKHRADLAHFEKFDPPVAAGIRHYAVAQFVVAIGLVLWIGALHVQSGPRAVLIPCVALWALLLSLGWLNQGKAFARYVELVRLLIVVPVLLLLAQQAGLAVGTTAWAVAAVYLVASTLWLVRVPKTDEVFA